MMLKSRKAFTLAEILITLTVFGILAAILLPAIAYIRPDKKKVMFKKAYSVAERMVYELVNDEDYYPTTGETVGFANTGPAAYLGHTYGGDSDAAAKPKFCMLFARKVNTTSDEVSCDAAHATPGGAGTFSTPSFSTTDGVAWYLPYSKFDQKDAAGEVQPETIYVDVNGSKEPNCRASQANCSRPDIFEIKVEPDGKMFVTGDKEKEYLNSNDPGNRR